MRWARSLPSSMMSASFHQLSYGHGGLQRHRHAEPATTPQVKSSNLLMDWGSRPILYEMVLVGHKFYAIPRATRNCSSMMLLGALHVIRSSASILSPCYVY